MIAERPAVTVARRQEHFEAIGDLIVKEADTAVIEILARVLHCRNEHAFKAI